MARESKKKTVKVMAATARAEEDPGFVDQGGGKYKLTVKSSEGKKKVLLFVDRVDPSDLLVYYYPDGLEPVLVDRYSSQESDVMLSLEVPGSVNVDVVSLSKVNAYKLLPDTEVINVTVPAGNVKMDDGKTLTEKVAAGDLNGYSMHYSSSAVTASSTAGKSTLTGDVVHARDLVLDVNGDLFEIVSVSGDDFTVGTKLTSLKGPQGAKGTDGKNGTNGKDGTNGTNGQDGADGEPGPAGPAGKSITAITLVNSGGVIVSGTATMSDQSTVNITVTNQESGGGAQ